MSFVSLTPAGNDVILLSIESSLYLNGGTVCLTGFIHLTLTRVAVNLRTSQGQVGNAIGLW